MNRNYKAGVVCGVFLVRRQCLFLQKHQVRRSAPGERRLPLPRGGGSARASPVISPTRDLPARGAGSAALTLAAAPQYARGE